MPKEFIRKSQRYKIVETEDLDYISGGATVVKEINRRFLPTSRTQRCNCGFFGSIKNGVTLNICDNCRWSQTPFFDSNETYCSKQDKQ